MVPLGFSPYFSSLSREKSIDFFFSLLQSKALCAEVPESFIQESLLDHQATLTQEPEPLSEDVIETLRERGRQFGKIVSKFYKPDHGYLPTGKASFEFPSSRGGLKGDLVFNDRLLNTPIQDSVRHDRMEPLVIGIFGQPGMGKSSRLAELIHSLSKLFPGTKRDELCYARSCNTDHWDGYKNQPIVVLDDLGQSLEGKDIKEFQTLVSCNPYIPPMADLADKGMYFTSPIIIFTTNLVYGFRLSDLYRDSYGILDDASFWRRVHIPLYVEDKIYHRLKEEPSWIREENLLMRKGSHWSEQQQSHFAASKAFFQRRSVFAQTGGFRQDLWKPIEPNYFHSLREVFRGREKFHANIKKTWIQKISCMTDDPTSLIGEEYFRDQIDPYLPDSLGFDMTEQQETNQYHLEFDAFPPDEPLPVRVESITEPLKVRNITAGKADTYCLKPLQRAMWLALGEEEQFVLTHGTNNLENAIKRIHLQSEPDDVWISGDFKAATDSVPILASKALMEGILESIDHEPTKRWAMKEVSPHLLVYPKKSGIKPCLQTNGQLMGSLLSFPLLCLLNDCTAKSIGLKPNQYLINGDDILMRTKQRFYKNWKMFVHNFGLKLSIGKNYVHPEYGTVNSQLIKGDQVLTSGKQRVLDRKSEVLGECLRDFEWNMELSGESTPTEVKQLFVSVNRTKLGRSVRSVHVPLSHGGLALNWGERNGDPRTKGTEIIVYLHDLLKKITPEQGCVAIPYLSVDTYNQDAVSRMDRLFNEPVSVKEFHEDFLHASHLRKTKLRVENNQSLRNLRGLEIESLPSLSFLKTIQVPFNDVKVRQEMQDQIDHAFLTNFLSSDNEFTYALYKETFLEAVRGIDVNCEVSTKFLVSVLDLDVRPDYLLKVGRPITFKSFDKGIYEKSLGTMLKPLSFDLPRVAAEDFSKELVSSYEAVIALFNYEEGSPENYSDSGDHPESLSTDSEGETSSILDNVN
jgi:hypothetical protein